MSHKRVVITGLGVIAPNGNNLKEYWDALLKGKSGIARLTYFDPAEFNSHIGGEIKNFDSARYVEPRESRKMEKFVLYAVAAAKMAMEDAEFDMNKADPNRVGVYTGSGIGGIKTMQEQHTVFVEKGPKRMSPHLIPKLITNIAAGHVSISIGAKGPNMCVVTACASAAHSLGEAWKVIRDGDADAMLAGGSEGALTVLGFGGFCAMRALSTRNDEPEKASRPFDKDRDGFVMSEGAGILLLEELEHAKKRNAEIYCEMVGYGLSGDAHHITAPTPNGEGAARAMEMAIVKSGINKDDYDYINAHGTSTKLNDKCETAAIKAVFGAHAKKLAVSSTKSMTGHLLGAAGAAELIATAMTIKHGIIPPTINYETPDPDCDLDYVPNEARKVEVKAVLSNSLGFGGHNATLAVKKFEG
ncbi:MAG: beta-ketoacyl-ACP synthase II [Candidatus Aureabacteria bacterium]|nr:beta-ketoacyl-ACP synthase II [Candidatus Auribacterota bacterium]